jgi:urease accessory protein
MLQRVDFRPVEAPQRVAALGRLAVKASGSRSRVDRLFQEGAAKIRFPTTRTASLEAVLINTAGGLTGGDRIAWEVAVGEAASAVLTTQACEKLYRSSGGRAEMSCRLSVGRGGRLAWLPQETIAYEQSAFARTLEIDMADDAEALIIEATVFGRLAMGETTRTATFSDRWRIRQSGRLIHAETFVVGPEMARMLDRAAATGGRRAVATVLLVAPEAERFLDAVRRIVGDNGGVSAWSVGGSGKLLARLVAGDGLRLRQTLVPLVELLNGQASLPKVWTL